MGAHTLLESVRPILLFDTTCLLCNKTVHFLLKVDHNKKFLFAGLSSDLGKLILEKYHVLDDSVIFYHKEKCVSKSSAFLDICKHLGFPYSLLLIFYIIPPFIRDRIYSIISKNRYRWFGTTDHCIIDSSIYSDRIIL